MLCLEKRAVQMENERVFGLWSMSGIEANDTELCEAPSDLSRGGYRWLRRTAAWPAGSG